MKIRSIISSTLLAAALGLGITAPAQAHDGIYSLRWLNRDHHHPRLHLDRHYGERHHSHFQQHWKGHHKRHHDRYAWRGHDDDRHDGYRRDRGRDYDRHDDHDRQRGH